MIERVGEEYLEEAVSVDVAETSPSCTVCRKLVVYKLSPGDCRHPGCGGDGGDAPEPIFTREDLHAVVEKWVKVNGACYYVETSSVEEAGAEDIDDVPASLAYDGPFLGCDDCQSQPINATKSVVTRVYVEGDVLKYDVEEWIIVDGRIVGFCNRDAQEVASTTCEE